jgi:hypothetical protein
MDLKARKYTSSDLNISNSYFLSRFYSKTEVMQEYLDEVL